jgi:hypothetical protein
MRRTLHSMALVVLVCAATATPVRAQKTGSADAAGARDQVGRMPIGATVRLKIRGGERLTAVLLSADDAGVRIKPATRVPERSRRVEYEWIEVIERREDHVSVGRYVGIGTAVGAAVLFLLITGL